MKINKNLYPEITDWHNLVLAWHKARRGKRYTPASATFECYLDRELIKLQDDLMRLEKPKKDRCALYRIKIKFR